jgi:hypothetical protein
MGKMIMGQGNEHIHEQLPSTKGYVSKKNFSVEIKLKTSSSIINTTLIFLNLSAIYANRS